MKTTALQSVRLKNFKAIQDSGDIRLTPLTVFIGNNGSGKSSVIEGLETLQAIVADGLDRAMQQWRGFEHIRNQAVSHEAAPNGQARAGQSNPMSFQLRGKKDGQSFALEMEVTLGDGGNELFIRHERLVVKDHFTVERDAEGRLIPKQGMFVLEPIQVGDGESMFGRVPLAFIPEWQFVSLAPQAMGSPTPQKRTSGPTRLARDGSNIADYLLSIRKIDASVLDGIVETLQYVLPYARDLQPKRTSELERAVYLQLTEAGFTVPGWLLSTGTLRLVALLALLRHPTPPRLIAIEEIENGLDPRSLQLVVEEIRNAIEGGKTQVLLTTHSPYLLDLLALSQIVLVERVDGQPTFTRPADQKSLRQWAEDFAPGQLYTMGRLDKGSQG
jgi:predicted ATPase